MLELSREQDYSFKSSETTIMERRLSHQEYSYEVAGYIGILRLMQRMDSFITFDIEDKINEARARHLGLSALSICAAGYEGPKQLHQSAEEWIRNYNYEGGILAVFEQLGIIKSSCRPELTPQFIDALTAEEGDAAIHEALDLDNLDQLIDEMVEYFSKRAAEAVEAGTSSLAVLLTQYRHDIAFFVGTYSKQAA